MRTYWRTGLSHQVGRTSVLDTSGHSMSMMCSPQISSGCKSSTIASRRSTRHGWSIARQRICSQLRRTYCQSFNSKSATAFARCRSLMNTPTHHNTSICSSLSFLNLSAVWPIHTGTWTENTSRRSISPRKSSTFWTFCFLWLMSNATKSTFKLSRTAVQMKTIETCCKWYEWIKMKSQLF